MKEVAPAASLLLKRGRFRIWEMVLEPGEGYPLHRHRHPYLSVVLEGSTLVLQGPRGRTERLTLRPGDVVYRVRPEQHSVRNVGRTRFRNRLIELTR